MEHTQTMEMINVLKLEQSIRWHLQYKLYPPVSSEMIPIAMKAVMLCRENNFNENVLIPFEGWIGWVVPAYMVVEFYQLEPWVNELEVV